MFKSFISMVLLEFSFDTENNSCEMLAKKLHEKIITSYGKNRDIKIEVSEDGENGVEMFFDKNQNI